MALGLMAVFPDIVRNIRKASIDNNMEWFEDKFSTLYHLEGHGFSVQSLHSTLTKLVKIKSQNTICLGEMDKLDVEIKVGFTIERREDGHQTLAAPGGHHPTAAAASGL